ncbi:MAG TPA: carboxypeptidase regulatory-like domain-containing protein, partial [Kofleriaceae bacterium]|nr:carboxypeptidase regulatory-like domain-containing protein [Kofleriaceae bacterium]
IQGTRPVENLRLMVETRDKVIEGIVLGPGGAPVADAWVTGFRNESSLEVGPVAVSSTDDDEDDDEGRARRRRWREGERPVLTDESGHFTITGLRAGAYDLEAEGLKGSARGEVDAVQAGTRDARIRLAALAGISGIVTSLGEPVTNYVIEAEGPTHRRTNVVDKEGRYRITRLDPGTYSLSVIADQGRGGAKVKVAANQTAEQNLQLIAYGSVRGVVVDAMTNEPIDGMTVFAFSQQGSDVEGLAMSFFSGDGPRTDAEGNFRVGRLGAGKGTFVVMDGDAGGFEMIAQKEFDLGPGQDLDLGEIRGHVMASIPKDQRGELGMTLSAATWASRPAQGAAKQSAEPPTGIDAATVYLWVDTVEEDGPAAAAGIAVGDRVVAIGGIDVAAVGAEMIERMLTPRRIKAGEPLPLVTDRGGKQRSVSVTPRPVAPE